MNTEAILVNAAGLSSIVALWMFAIGSAFKSKTRIVYIAGIVVLAFCFTCVSISLLVRTAESARFPITNLYESLLLFSWGLLLVSIVLFSRQSLPQLGWLTALSVSLVFLYASWLPPGQHVIKPLMPALVSYWRAIHVPPLIVSYAFFVMSGLLSIVNLWSGRRRMTAAACLLALLVCLLSIYLGTLKLADVQTIQLGFWIGLCISCAATFGLFFWEAHRPFVPTKLNDLADGLSQKSIAIAFPLLTFGIITGALWANHAWGAYWTWDPKESMSLATWLSYAAYLHLRSRSSCRSDTLSLCAFLGLLLTILTYLGFTFLDLGGLHTYGNIT